MLETCFNFNLRYLCQRLIFQIFQHKLWSYSHWVNYDMLWVTFTIYFLTKLIVSVMIKGELEVIDKNVEHFLSSFQTSFNRLYCKLHYSAVLCSLFKFLMGIEWRKAWFNERVANKLRLLLLKKIYFLSLVHLHFYWSVWI